MHRLVTARRMVAITVATTVIALATTTTGAGAVSDDTPAVAIRGLDNAVWVRTGPTGGGIDDLVGWYSLGGQTPSAPAMSGDAVVVRGLDDQIWARRNSPVGSTTWTSWQALGGATTDTPVVDWDGNVYIRGLDGAVWTRDRTGDDTYGPWVSLGGAILGLPAVNDGLVVARGTDGGVYANPPYDNNSHVDPGWLSLGGATTDTPAITPEDGDLIVTIRGLDGGIWALTLGGPSASDHGPWESAGGPIVGTPLRHTGVTFARNPSDDVFVVAGPLQQTLPARFVDAMSGSDFGVFGRGTDNRPYVIADNDTGAVVVSLGGATTSAVAAPPLNPTK